MQAPTSVWRRTGGCVAGYLNEVFRGVGVGGGEEGDDGFVEDCGWVFGVENLGEAGSRVGEWVAQMKERHGNRGCIRAGEADDADAASAGRGGDGDDGVGVMHGARLIHGIAAWVRLARGSLNMERWRHTFLRRR